LPGLWVFRVGPVDLHFFACANPLPQGGGGASAEPTSLRATPWLGGVNTQHTVTQSVWRPQKWTGKPGTQSNQWGDVWNSKGTGHLGKGQAAGGYQWGQRRDDYTMKAFTVAPALVSGKGAWGGRGRGRGQGVPWVPFCSGLPGSPPRREELAPLGSKGGEASWSQPGALRNWLGKGWNLPGQGQLGKGHWPGGTGLFPVAAASLEALRAPWSLEQLGPGDLEWALGQVIYLVSATDCVWKLSGSCCGKNTAPRCLTELLLLSQATEEGEPARGACEAGHSKVMQSLQEKRSRKILFGC